MGCTSSTQTTAQDTTRPNTKQDGSTSGTSNKNGGPAADKETIPKQTHAEAPQTSSAPPEIQSSDAAVAHTEPEAAAAEAATVDQPAEPEPKPEPNPSTTENTEEPAPALSENTSETPADPSPPEEAPASGEDT